jgi:hypothetical protein
MRPKPGIMWPKTNEMREATNSRVFLVLQLWPYQVNDVHRDFVIIEFRAGLGKTLSMGASLH